MRKPARFGKYLLLDRIAVGGMAEVFVAKAFGAEGFQRLLAIKKILPTMGEDREFIHMFVDEARISVQLAHPNVVQVLELGKHDESLYIAMEYISGRDLRQVMERFRKRQQPMPLPQICMIVAEVCEALDFAHRKRDAGGRPLGIVHRDVSPQNVLVSFEGEVKLIDFGIAKAESRLQRTQAGILKGKFSYMSPEQVQGHAVDSRSDIFACGVLLWEMIAGEKLFVGGSDFVVLEKVRSGVIPPLKPSCPAELRKIVLKALAADPARRYQSASELHDELLRFTMAAGGLYGRRQLAEWMREQFQSEWEREQQRLRAWMGAAQQEVTPTDPSRKELLVPDQDTLVVGPMSGAGIGAPDEMTVVQPSPERASADAPAFDNSGERTGARRAMRSAPMSRPARPPRSTKSRRRWLFYALGPLAVLGVVVAAVVLAPPDEHRRRVKLVVTRTPPVEAELTLDGKSAGPLPVIRSVAAGSHHIEVRAAGFKPFTADVDVPPRRTPFEIDAQLAPESPMKVEGVILKGPRAASPPRSR